MKKLIVIFILLLGSTAVMAHNKVVVIPMGSDAAPLQNVITVAMKNGDFTDPVVAMNSIAGLADENNRYLMFIGPGVYTLTETLVMQEYVDISGSGQNATKLIGAISSAEIDPSSALVQGSDHAAISSLSIENKNIGGGSHSVGIYNSTSSLTMYDMTIAASGTYSYGVYNTSSSPIMSDMTIAVSGTYSYGVYNTSSSPIMSDMTIAASSTYSNGVYNTSSSPRMSSVVITSSLGNYSFGVVNAVTSSSTMSDMTITVSGGSLGNQGVVNESISSLAMSDIIITVSGAGTSNYGILHNTTDASARIRNSTISASGGASAYSVYGASNETYISDSVLIGSARGTLMCSFTFNGTGTDLTPDCIP